MAKQTAQLNFLHIAPRKVRLVSNTLKGLNVSEAEAQLMLRTNRACKPLLKLLRSAISNAKNKKMNAESLYVESIFVNEGPMLKRIMPRAMGRATPIHKKMSHITLILEEGSVKPSRFTILPPPKKSKKSDKKPVKPKAPELKTEKPKEKAGFFKKMFRRKSI